MQTVTDKVAREPLWTRDFVLISLANLFIFLGFQMLMPVIPVYATALGGSEAWAGVVAGSFTLSVVLMRPVADNLLDKQGRRGVYLIGLLIFLLCTVAYHWVPSILTLLALRFLHGFGWGTSSTASNTIASDIIPKSRMGEGMGYFGLTGTLAMAVAPALGLELMSGYGFNTVFTAATVFVVLAVLVALPINYLKPKSNSRGGKTAIIEKGALTPGIIMLFVTITYGSIVTFLALYAAHRQVENIGLFFTVYALSLLVCRPIFGRLADSKGYASAVLPGLLAVFAAMLILFFAHSLFAFLVAGFIYGIGFGGTQPALQAMAVRNIDPSRRGAANATFFLGFDIGIGIGSIVWGLIAEAMGYQYIYLFALIPTLIAFVLFLNAYRQVSCQKTS